MKRYRFTALLLLAALLCRPPLHAAGTKPVIRSGDADSPRIALTFDDGPHPKRTQEILDILEEYHIRATFFVIGENAVYYPDPLRRAVRLGHEIGNHTFSHGNVQGMSLPTLKKELQDTEKVIFELTGAHVSLFRPPEGACTEGILEAAESVGYSVVLWTVDTHDWAHATTESIVKTVKKNVRGGSILLFHDYTSGKAHTADALRILIPFLLADGFEFVTVSELAKETDI